MIAIPENLLSAIWEEGERAYPEEGAGVLLGHGAEKERYVEQILPLRNQFQAELRQRRYLITPQDMIKAEERAEELGLMMIGIFHSHPDHPALPSEFDRELAFPWYSYLITSIEKGAAQKSRSWRLTEERTFVEERLLIERKKTLEDS